MPTLFAVPSPTVREPAPGFGRIVVGVDGSPNSVAALRWALREAASRHADVVAVYAYAPDGVGATSSGARTALASVVERVTAAPHVVEALEHVAVAAPAPTLLHAAAEADLLVLGARGTGGFAGLRMGGVSMHCVHNAPCPVVVVPGEDD
jgi:nucleotide-binding universal stress UspA family protein